MPAPLCFAALLDCYNLRPIPCPPRFAPITFPVSLAIVMYKSFDKIHLALSRLQNWIGVTRIIYKLLIRHMIGTDVVYSEHLLDPLLQTIHDLSGPRTTIVLGYEIRSTSVHEEMLQMWKSNFDVKTVPRTKMDKKYQHPTIQLYVMEPKSSAEIALAVDQDKDQASESKDRESDQKEKKMISMYEAENEKDTRDCAAATGVSS